MSCRRKLMLKKLLMTKLREVSLEMSWLDADQGGIYWRAEKTPEKEEAAREELILILTEKKQGD